jgi:hypothetical protein
MSATVSAPMIARPTRVIVATVSSRSRLPFSWRLASSRTSRCAVMRAPPRARGTPGALPVEHVRADRRERDAVRERHHQVDRVRDADGLRRDEPYASASIAATTSCGHTPTG